MFCIKSSRLSSLFENLFEKFSSNKFSNIFQKMLRFLRKVQHAMRISWYLGSFSTRSARFWGLFWCTSESSYLDDNLIENHSMRRQFHDTWIVFRPAPHVCKDYFGIRRDPHAQDTIFSQITACGINFMVPGGLFDPLSTFFMTISV